MNGALYLLFCFLSSNLLNHVECTAASQDNAALKYSINLLNGAEHRKSAVKYVQPSQEIKVSFVSCTPFRHPDTVSLPHAQIYLSPYHKPSPSSLNYIQFLVRNEMKNIRKMLSSKSLNIGKSVRKIYDNLGILKKTRKSIRAAIYDRIQRQFKTYAQIKDKIYQIRKSEILVAGKVNWLDSDTRRLPNNCFKLSVPITLPPSITSFSSELYEFGVNLVGKYAKNKYLYYGTAREILQLEPGAEKVNLGLNMLKDGYVLDRTGISGKSSIDFKWLEQDKNLELSVSLLEFRNEFRSIKVENYGNQLIRDEKEGNSFEIWIKISTGTIKIRIFGYLQANDRTHCFGISGDFTPISKDSGNKNFFFDYRAFALRPFNLMEFISNSETLYSIEGYQLKINFQK